MADAHDTTTLSKSPAFQFYPKDFLTDENVRMMSFQERGVYITLICLCWSEGTLPAGVDRLARLCGAPLSAFRRLWPALEPCFRVDSERSDRLIHPRLEKEREKQADYKRRQSDKGRASGASRRTNRGSTVVQPDANHGSTAVHSGSGSQPNPVGTETKSSSSFSSSSSDFSQSATRSSRALQGGGVMAGTLPRDHLNCRHPCVRVCISQKQHAILRERHGGDDAALDAFYAEVRGRLSPDVPIGDKPWQFWDAQFAAKFGTASSGNTKTSGNAAAIARFIARGQA